MSRDTWGGDASSPMSYNAWLYVYENPVRLIDPSGHDPYWCEGDSDCYKKYRENWEGGPPQIKGYNQIIEPDNITWDSNSYADSINANGAHGTGTNGTELERNYPGSQLNVPDMPFKCDHWEEGWICLFKNKHNEAYCGDISIAAVLAGYGNDVNAVEVIKDIRGLLGLPNNNGTSAKHIAFYINSRYSPTLVASVHTPPTYPFHSLRDWMFEQLTADQVIFTLVQIVGGNRSYSPPGSRTDPTIPNDNGRISGSGGIPHWVVITGISHQWETDPNEVALYPSANGLAPSPWNWIRVYNPFGNQTEYYWWGDFYPSWNRNDEGGHSGLVSTVLVGPPKQ